MKDIRTECQINQFINMRTILTSIFILISVLNYAQFNQKENTEINGKLDSINMLIDSKINQNYDDLVDQISLSKKILDDYQISNDNKFAAILEKVNGIEKNEEDLENHFQALSALSDELKKSIRYLRSIKFFIK